MRVCAALSKHVARCQPDAKFRSGRAVRSLFYGELPEPGYREGPLVRWLCRGPLPDPAQHFHLVSPPLDRFGAPFAVLIGGVEALPRRAQRLG